MRPLRFALVLWIAAALPALAADAPRGDFADSLSGGPNFWQVTGVAADDQLMLRRGPTAKAPVVLCLADGAVLRNQGCAIHGGQRWCEVSPPENPSRRGWVAGRYLRESSAAP